MVSAKTGFVMAAAGSAIELGNIWGFPTQTASNGGAAFIIIGIIIFCMSSTVLLNFDLLFDFVVDLTTVYSQPILGVLLCLFVGWIWHRDNFLTEIKRGHSAIEGGLFWKIWPTYVKLFCPVLIMAAFVQSIV